jgi:hypothetical protein
VFLSRKIFRKILDLVANVLRWSETTAYSRLLYGSQYWLDNKQLKGNRNFLALKQVSLFTSTGVLPGLKLAVLKL